MSPDPSSVLATGLFWQEEFPRDASRVSPGYRRVSPRRGLIVLSAVRLCPPPISFVGILYGCQDIDEVSEILLVDIVKNGESAADVHPVRDLPAWQDQPFLVPRRSGVGIVLQPVQVMLHDTPALLIEGMVKTVRFPVDPDSIGQGPAPHLFEILVLALLPDRLELARKPPPGLQVCHLHEELVKGLARFLQPRERRPGLLPDGDPFCELGFYCHLISLHPTGAGTCRARSIHCTYL
jgi:hypothetical protein